MAVKVAVLEQLAGQPDALSLPELMYLLPAGLAERSVRRWLAELIAEGRIERTGQKRGTRYRARAGSSAHASRQARGPQGAASTPAPTQRTPAPLFSEVATDAMAHVRRPVAYDADGLAAYDPDPVVEAYKRHIDRTLLRQNLQRSVEERVRNLMALQELAAEARRAGRKAQLD